jgi:hypothetical protein
VSPDWLGPVERGKRERLLSVGYKGALPGNVKWNNLLLLLLVDCDSLRRRLCSRNVAFVPLLLLSLCLSQVHVGIEGLNSKHSHLVDIRPVVTTDTAE